MSEYVEVKLQFACNDNNKKVVENLIEKFLESDLGKRHFEGLNIHDVITSWDFDGALYTGFGGRTWSEVANQFIEAGKIYGYKLYKKVPRWEEVN